MLFVFFSRHNRSGPASSSGPHTPSPSSPGTNSVPVAISASGVCDAPHAASEERGPSRTVPRLAARYIDSGREDATGARQPCRRTNVLLLS